MFVPVACSQCGKPFQVPEASVGGSVACPWCGANVLGLPVAAPVAPRPAEVLSLDDTPPKSRRWMVTVGVAAAVVVGGAALTFLALRLSRTAEGDWVSFSPPDASFAVLLPSTPIEETAEPNPHSPALVGGRRFVAERRNRAVVSVAWRDIDPERGKLARPEDLIDAEVRHRKDVLRATSATRPAPYRVNDHHGAEVRYDTPAGTRVELLIVVPTGARPRVYVLAVEGKGVSPDDAAVRRFFHSLRVAG